MNSYLDALLRYFDFSGRSSRKQFWLFALTVFLLSVAAALVDATLLPGLSLKRSGLGPLATFLALLNFIPTISVTVRRLHDIGKSGWWYLLGFVPLAGLILLVWFCRASDDGPNDYGDDPRRAVPPSSRPGRPPAAPRFGRPVFGAGQSGVSLADIQQRRAATQR